MFLPLKTLHPDEQTQLFGVIPAAFTVWVSQVVFSSFAKEDNCSIVFSLNTMCWVPTYVLNVVCCLSH